MTQQISKQYSSPGVNFGHLATRAEFSIESIDAEKPNHQTQEKEAHGQSESRCYSSGRIGSALPFHRPPDSAAVSAGGSQIRERDSPRPRLALRAQVGRLSLSCLP